MTASRFQTLPILASARRHERGGEKFKKKEEEEEDSRWRTNFKSENFDNF